MNGYHIEMFLLMKSWRCKILQNWKALVSTDLVKGVYFNQHGLIDVISAGHIIVSPVFEEVFL